MVGTFDEAAELRKFYETADDAEARSILDELFVRIARPTVERVVRRRLRGLDLDAEDVAQDAIVGLAHGLLDGRRGRVPVVDLAAYAARTADHACDELFRRRFRLRYNAMKRVLTQLRKNQAFYEWPTGVGPLGALREWPPPPPSPAPERARRLESDPQSAVEQALRESPPPKIPPKTAPCIRAALSWCQGALSVDALTLFVQTARNEFDEAPAVLDESVVGGSAPPAASDDVSFLVAVWNQIRRLQPRQAAALLLNLRFDAELGSEAFEQFGVAEAGEVAAVLRMDPELFDAEVRSKPSWPDRRIAEHLGCTVVQVSGLRSTARRTLASRLAGTVGPDELRFNL